MIITSFSIGHEVVGQNWASREDGHRSRPLTPAGGVWLKDGRGDSRHGTRDSIGSSAASGGIVRSGRIDNAENISVAVLIFWLIDSARSQVQLVDGVNAFNAGEGRRIGDTLGSTRKATKGAQYGSGLDFHSGWDGSTWMRVCLGGLRSLQRLVVQQF
jgi:hypothetical protein